MALFDIFKSKKKEAKEKPAEKKAEAKPRPAKAKPTTKPAKAKTAKPKSAVKSVPKPKKTPVIAYRVLKNPQITEKATDLTKVNQYVFKVFAGANKKDIKKTIEDLYGVDVVKIQIINVPRKQRRLGRVEGWRKGYKKAIVRIKEGQKIEVLPR